MLERFSIFVGCLMQCNLTHVNNLGFLVLGGWIKKFGGCSDGNGQSQHLFSEE
jgi:hypothetical protein